MTEILVRAPSSHLVFHNRQNCAENPRSDKMTIFGHLAPDRPDEGLIIYLGQATALRLLSACTKNGRRWSASRVGVGSLENAWTLAVQ